MTTLKEFEEALREQGMHMALAVLERLRQQDRAKRTIAPARRVTGKKMTPELARKILELHATTDMTQQEIAFQLGVNQGRVNEVVKRQKWIRDDPNAPEAVARDRALAKIRRAQSEKPSLRRERLAAARSVGDRMRKPKRSHSDQLSLEDFLSPSEKSGV